MALSIVVLFKKKTGVVTGFLIAFPFQPGHFPGPEFDPWPRRNLNKQC